MNFSILLLEQIIELFLMMFMGYILVKLKKVKSEDSNGLSVVVLYLVMPCVILHAFQVDYTIEKVQGLLLAFIAAILVQMAQIYKKDAGYASAINVITTITCIITMPFMVWLYML